MTERENMQTLQTMIFHTAAGALMRGLFMAAGHFDVAEELPSDKERIEQNLVKGFMASCGIGLQMISVPIAGDEEEQNVIDQVLNEGATEHE